MNSVSVRGHRVQRSGAADKEETFATSLHSLLQSNWMQRVDFHVRVSSLTKLPRHSHFSAAVHKTLTMFKGLTKDLTGTADICNTAKDFSKLHACSYLLPGEDIMLAFESAKEEFAFTNEALIMTLGENATTTRKFVQRATYRDCPISKVFFETTGRVDRDCEIKFQIGEYDVSIDIARKEEEFAKGFYKTLLLLAREQKSRARSWSQAEKGLGESADSLKIMTGHDLVSQASGAAAWLENAFIERNPRCYREVIAGALVQTVAEGKK